jgi:hypothetical protein
VAAAPGCVPRCDPLTNATPLRPSGRSAVPLPRTLRSHKDHESRAVTRPFVDTECTAASRLPAATAPGGEVPRAGSARTGYSGPGSPRTPRPAGFPVGVRPPAARPVSTLFPAGLRPGHGRQMVGRGAAKRPGGFNGLRMCCPSW